MAAPANKTIGDLTGKWIMNKTLSDSTEPALALQGIGFLTRKGIGLTTVTLQVKQYNGPPSPPSTQTGDVVHIDIEQTATGGINGTTENRSIDDTQRGHSDWLFGDVKARSKWLTAEQLAAVAQEHGEHLGKDWIEDAAEAQGPGGASHVMNYVESTAGWTAVQIWGFQMIGGERRYARNVLVKKNNKVVEVRLVYDYASE
ncbi:uncharacterized protein BCR38DRAFT_340226 [Pseudomassariella vexata]|uniref:LCCL domain-containing protein n=1 Tax=Pseudomassariella vexata TaxID=1141098 RepID=A0A1Y2E3L9_9PEZI|nr:uncharacterized protein BCR38DRAFT_340226 [Pseudomassariella vexata]ORY66153.1 hypothetical protein BCR38DRAFT_340226 [Pseudomassariella vexata]